MKRLALVFVCIILSLLKSYNAEYIQTPETSDQFNQLVAKHLRGRSPVIKKPSILCYSCIDCPNVNNTQSARICDYTKHPGCVTYAETFSGLNDPIYIRGCAGERGTCDEIEKKHRENGASKLLGCHECAESFCNTNGVTRSIPNVVAAVFLIVIVPLVCKTTFS